MSPSPVDLKINPDSPIAWVKSRSPWTGLTPLIRASDGVHGQVLVDVDAAKPLQPTDVLQVHLYGYLKVAVGELGSLSKALNMDQCKVRKEVLHLSTRRPTNVDGETSTSGHQHSFTFDLMIPGQFRPHSTCWNGLPSSLQVHSVISSTGRATTQYEAKLEISYHVKALVLRGREVLMSIVKPVALYDSPGIEPPLWIPDFSPEYIIDAAVATKASFSRRRRRVNVTTSQPAPFIFSGTSECASTTLSLDISVTSDSEQLDRETLASFEAAATWRLTSTTFFSLSDMHSVPLASASQNAKDVVKFYDTGPVHSVRQTALAWRREGVDARTWTASMDLRIALADDKWCSPSFRSPHLVRRYGLLVELQLKGASKSKARLHVPCQIVYERAPNDTDTMTLVLGMRRVNFDPQNWRGSAWGTDDCGELPEYSP